VAVTFLGVLSRVSIQATFSPGIKVYVDGDLDAAVAHLLLNVGGRDAGLNQQRAEGVAQVLKAEFPKPSVF